MWGEAWTGEKVWDRLVAAFVLMNGAGIYNPHYHTFLTGVDGARVEPLELISLTAEVLARKDRRRFLLLRAARCVSQGMTVEEYCRQHGVSRRNFDRWKAELTTRVASRIAGPPPPVGNLTMSKVELH